MKKPKKLCKVCPELDFCETLCVEALNFEYQDNSSNYIKEKYVPKGTARNWHEQSIVSRKLLSGETVDLT